MTAIGGDSYAESVSDSYLVGVTFPAPDQVGDSEEPELVLRRNLVAIDIVDF
jgi:hypothetical protein